MIFGNPNLLPVLVITEIFLVIFLGWAWKKRMDHTARFVRPRLLASLSVGISRGRRLFRLLLLVLAVGLILLALARPQTIRGYQEAPRQEIDLMVAVDVSRSMLTEDVSPSRLAYAQEQLKALADLAARTRLGLIAFSGAAFIQCPLSRDRDAFRQSVASLKAGMIEPGGTSLAVCIRQAMTAFEEHSRNARALLILSDFEDHEGDALEAASQAADTGAHLFTVGIGTPDGGHIPIRTNGNIRLLEDREGRRVKSQLDAGLLQEVATAGKGEHFVLQGDDPMARVLARLTAVIEADRRRAAEKERQHPRATLLVTEHYRIPLMIGMLLLLLEMFFPERILPRRPSGRPPMAAIRSMVIIWLVLQSVPVRASPQSALRLYRSGQYQAALHEYTRLHRQHPEDDRLAYNAGNAAYQAGRYAEAIQWFEQSMNASRPALNQKSIYNLGNCYYRLGQAETNLYRRAIQWNQALQHYDQALQLEPKDEDAAFNRRFLVERLMELQQQLPHQSLSGLATNSANASQTGRSNDQASTQPAETGRANLGPSGASTNAGQAPSKPPPRHPSTRTNAAPPGPLPQEEATRLLEAHRDHEQAMPLELLEKPAVKNSRSKDW